MKKRATEKKKGQTEEGLVQHAKSKILLGVYWLYLGGVYPIVKSEASSHRSAGRPNKNIDPAGVRGGRGLSANIHQ